MYFHFVSLSLYLFALFSLVVKNKPICNIATGYNFTFHNGNYLAENY